MKGILLNAGDLESARHQTYKTRGRMTYECIRQQAQCLEIKQMVGSPIYIEEKARTVRDGGTYYFEKKGCPELLSASCVIEPVGILNSSGYNCGGDPWDDGPDCSEKFIPTAMCSDYYNIQVPGCKGFRDRELFIKDCWNRFGGTNGSLFVNGMCNSKTDTKVCCRYSKGDPEITNLFK